MPKNIVVLSDGTGQEGGKGADRNTNVYKMFTMLEDRTDRQLVFYDPGLGTGWRKVTGNAFGAGISRNVREAYRFIFDNYEVGDRIYLMGFSRGATTVRSVAGMLDKFGILPRSRPDLIHRAYQIYKTRAPQSSWWARKRIQRYAKGSWLSRTLKTLGVGNGTFDLRRPDELAAAVAAVPPTKEEAARGEGEQSEVLDAAARRVATFLSAAESDRLGAQEEWNGEFAERLLDLHCPGWSDAAARPQCPEELPKNPREFMRQFLLESRAREFIAASYTHHPKIEFLGVFDTVAALYRIPIVQTKFHDLSLTWSVRNAYHALALDDERRPFAPTLWEKTYPHQTVRQVWFNGMHTDVGGGYLERGLADIALAWMLRAAHESGILLDPGGVTLTEDPLDAMHNSRGTPVTRALYFGPKARALDRPDKLPEPWPIIHESVFVRALQGAKEYGKRPWWRKSQLGEVGPEELRQRLDAIFGKPGIGAELYAAYAAALDGEDPPDPRIEPWVRYDQQELLAAQEERWAEWVGHTTRFEPRHFATAKSEVLSWFQHTLADSEHAREGAVRVWHPKTGDQVRSQAGTRGVVAVAPGRTADGTAVVASACGDGSVKVRDLRTGEELHHLPGDDVVAVAMTTGGGVVTGSSLGKVWLHDLDAGKAHELGGHEGEVLAVTAGRTPDGRTRVASASWDGTVCVWDAHAGESSLLHDHGAPVLSVAMSPDGTAVVTGCTDGVVRVWALDSGDVRSLEGHTAPVLGVAVAADGSTVVSGSADRDVRVWNLSGGDPLVLSDHTGWVRAVAVSPAGDTVVSASDDTTLKMWDLRTGEERRTLTGHTGPVTSVEIDPDGWIVSGSLEQSLLARLAAPVESGQSAPSAKVERRYHRRTKSGAEYDARTALLVVDMQNDFADQESGTLAVPGGDEVVDDVNEHIDAAVAAGAYVVYTQDWHPKRSPHFEQYGGKWPVHCIGGTWGARFHPKLNSGAGPSVRKGSNGEDGYSGFMMTHPVTKAEVPTELDRLLRERGVEKVVVVGLALDFVVKHTALDAAARGYDTIVPRAATRAIGAAARGQDPDRVVKELVDHGVDVV